MGQPALIILFRREVADDCDELRIVDTLTAHRFNCHECREFAPIAATANQLSLPAAFAIEGSANSLHVADSMRGGKVSVQRHAGRQRGGVAHHRRECVVYRSGMQRPVRDENALRKLSKGVCYESCLFCRQLLFGDVHMDDDCTIREWRVDRIDVNPKPASLRGGMTRVILRECRAHSLEDRGETCRDFRGFLIRTHRYVAPRQVVLPDASRRMCQSILPTKASPRFVNGDDASFSVQQCDVYRHRIEDRGVEACQTSLLTLDLRDRTLGTQ